MRLLLTVVILCVSGCIDVPCETDRVAGVCLIKNGFEVDDTQVEEIVYIMEGEVNKHYPDVGSLPELFKNNHVSMEFLDGELQYECSKIDDGIYQCTTLVGLNLNGATNYVLYRECLGRTPVAHELLHSVEVLALGAKDANHSTPYLHTSGALDNESVEEQETVEWQAERYAIFAFDECERYRKTFR